MIPETGIGISLIIYKQDTICTVLSVNFPIASEIAFLYIDDHNPKNFLGLRINNRLPNTEKGVIGWRHHVVI